MGEFKCSYRSCGEGMVFRDHSKRGPYHGVGIKRVAFLTQNRNDWDAFCPAHAHTGERHRTEAVRYFEAHKNRTPSHLPEPAPPRPDRPQSTAGNGKGKRKAGGAVAGGTGAGRDMTEESIAAQRALLRITFPRELPLSENDADLSQTLERRQQRHAVMDIGKVHMPWCPKWSVHV